MRMAFTLAEIAVAIIAAVLLFKFGVELAPFLIRWWKGEDSAGSGADSAIDEERNDHEQEQ